MKTNLIRSGVGLLLACASMLSLSQSVFGATHNVTLSGFAFSPSSLNIKAGDTVVFTTASGAHTTTGTGPEAFCGSQTLSSAGTKSCSVTFASPGTFTFQCNFHFSLGMKGTITVAPANVPPTVSMTAPLNGTRFFAPADVKLEADAADAGGVAQVEFFTNAKPVGVAPTSPYRLTVGGLTAGPYAITAVATDNQGLSSTSAVVQVEVLVPPMVSLASFTRQADGAVGFRVSRGVADQTGIVEGSDDLNVWTPIRTNIFPPNLCPICPAYDFLDEQAADHPRRFYRARILP